MYSLAIARLIRPKEPEGPAPELAQRFAWEGLKLRAQQALWWRKAQLGKARFKVCQFIPGDPSADDACKCGEITRDGGPYCAHHRERCIMPGRTKASRLKATLVWQAQ